MMSFSDKKGFRVWNHSREIKKALVCSPTIEEIFAKASSKGISGSKLILEKDGCEIDDTESLIYFCNETLQILKDDEEWCAPGTVQIKTDCPTKAESPIICNVGIPESKEISIEPPPLAAINNFLINDEVSDEQIAKEFMYSAMNNSEDDGSLQNDPLEYEEKFNIVDYSEEAEENNLLEEVNSPGGSYSANDFSISSLIPASPIIDFSEYLSIENMPEYIKSFCENWESSGSTNRIVHYIVTQMRHKNKQVPITAFRAVACELGKKYPQLLDKDEDGNIISLVPTTLINKIINHHNYLNRPMKRPNSHLNNDQSYRNGPGTTKRSNPSKTTCLSSTCLVKPLPPSEIKKVKIELRTLANMPSLNNEEMARSHQLMQISFGNQRQFLSSVNKPTIDMVKTEWPLLLRREWIYKHFNQTLNYDITQFSRMINQRKGKVIDYGKQLSHKECKEFFEENEDMEDDYLCILFLTVYFKESSDFMFQMFKTGSVIYPPTDAPWLAVIDTGSEKNIQFFSVYVDKKLVNSDSKNFIDGLQQVFALYYNLNTRYPAEISLTMEFLQRYFAQIHHEVVRGNKRNISRMSKVLSLIRRLRDMK